MIPVKVIHHPDGSSTIFASSGRQQQLQPTATKRPPQSPHSSISPERRRRTSNHLLQQMHPNPIHLRKCATATFMPPPPQAASPAACDRNCRNKSAAALHRSSSSVAQRQSHTSSTGFIYGEEVCSSLYSTPKSSSESNIGCAVTTRLHSAAAAYRVRFDQREPGEEEHDRRHSSQFSPFTYIETLSIKKASSSQVGGSNASVNSCQKPGSILIGCCTSVKRQPQKQHQEQVLSSTRSSPCRTVAATTTTIGVDDALQTRRMSQQTISTIHNQQPAFLTPQPQRRNCKTMLLTKLDNRNVIFLNDHSSLYLSLSLSLW